MVRQTTFPIYTPPGNSIHFGFLGVTRRIHGNKPQSPVSPRGVPAALHAGEAGQNLTGSVSRVSGPDRYRGSSSLRSASRIQNCSG